MYHKLRTQKYEKRFLTIAKEKTQNKQEIIIKLLEKNTDKL